MSALALLGVSGCFDFELDIRMVDFKNAVVSITMCAPLEEIERARSLEFMKDLADMYEVLYDKKKAAAMFKRGDSEHKITFLEESGRRCMNSTAKETDESFESDKPPLLLALSDTLYIGCDFKDMLATKLLGPDVNEAVVGFFLEALADYHFGYRLELPEGFTVQYVLQKYVPYDLATFNPKGDAWEAARENGRKALRECREELGKQHTATRGLALRVPLILLALGKLEVHYSVSAQTEKAHLQFGEFLVAKRAYAEAIRECDAAIGMNPQSYEAFLIRGRARAGAGKRKEAIDDLTRAIKGGFRLEDSYYRRGDAHFDFEEYELAREDYENAVSRKPDHLDAINGRALSSLRLGRFEEAIRDLLRVNKEAPQFADAFSSISEAYMGLERYEDALAAISKAIELNGDDPEFRRRRGNCRFALKAYEEALADYSEGIRLSPSADLLYWHRGNARMMLERYKEALADYSEAVKLDPKFPDYYGSRASAYHRLRSQREAVSDATRAIELTKPPAAGPYVNRGWYYVWAGDLEKARRDFEMALKIDGKEANALCNMGLYHWVARKDRAKALEYYEKAFQNGFRRFEEFYKDDSDGHFLGGLNDTPAFKALVAKYGNAEAPPGTAR